MPEPDRIHPEKKSDPPADPWKAAGEYGIDLDMLAYNLTLTPAERLAKHEHARQTVRTLREAGIKHYGYDPRPSSPPDETSV